MKYEYAEAAPESIGEGLNWAKFEKTKWDYLSNYRVSAAFAS